MGQWASNKNQFSSAAVTGARLWSYDAIHLQLYSQFRKGSAQSDVTLVLDVAFTLHIKLVFVDKEQGTVE